MLRHLIKNSSVKIYNKSVSANEFFNGLKNL